MSNERKKVRATSQSSVSPPAAAPAAAPTLSSRRKALLLISGGMVLTGFVAWFFWSNPLASNRKDAAKLPDIPTAGLDATAATLIQQHLDAVGAAPRSASAWGKLGAVLKSFGFREQAIHCLAEAERLDPKEPRWPYLQAMLRSSEAAPAAIEKLRKAVRLCGNDPEMPRLRLARLLAETGKEDEAREQLRQLLGAKPNFGPARMLMAQIDQGNGKWDDAMRMAKGATTNVYTARAAWNLLSALHRRRGDTNGAEFASRRAAAVRPDAPWPDPFEDEVLAWRTDARSLSDRAQNYLMAGRAGDAVPLVTRLVQEHPDFAETWLLLGRTQYLQNEPAAAEQSFRRFVQMDTQSVNGHFQLGMSLLAQKRYPEAVDAFRDAISLKRDFGPAFFNLGFALAKSGRQREAIPAFEEAIRHSPEIIDSYILLADLHLQLGQKAEAIELAKLAERLEPNDRRLPALRRKIEQQ